MPSEKILFARYNGLTEYAHIDPMKPNDLVIETVQDDYQAILDQVKVDRDAPVGKEWRLAARLPMMFYHQAAQMGAIHDKTYWRKLLDDPDLKGFRVWGGRIGTPGQI
jgi:hypothetical protein